jgi:hypothetical protein
LGAFVTRQIGTCIVVAVVATLVLVFLKDTPRWIRATLSIVAVSAAAMIVVIDTTRR